MKKFLPLIFSALILVGIGYIVYDTVHLRYGSYIRQRVRNCNGTGFQVETYYFHKGDIIYSSRTWLANGLRCIPADSVAIVKKNEWEAAEAFWREFKKIPD